MFSYFKFKPKKTRTIGQVRLGVEELSCRAIPTNLAPVIESFTLTEESPGMFWVEGQVADESMEGMYVTLAGDPVSLDGLKFEVGSDGWFGGMVYVNTDGSDSGLITAVTEDYEGLFSNHLTQYVAPTTV